MLYEETNVTFKQFKFQQAHVYNVSASSCIYIHHQVTGGKRLFAFCLYL